MENTTFNPQLPENQQFTVKELLTKNRPTKEKVVKQWIQNAVQSGRLKQVGFRQGSGRGRPASVYQTA